MLRRFALFAMFLLCPSVAHADWYRAESQNFILYMDDSESDVRGLIERLELFDNFLRRVSGAPSEPPLVKLRVFAVRNQGRVQSIYGERRDVAGFYIADPRGPYAVIPEGGAGRGLFGQTAEGILYHEYAHHFLQHYFPSVYPGWYQEGFAEFYSSVEFEGENQIALGKPVNSRAPSLRLGRWIPFEEILSGGEVDSEMLYAQAWLFTHYAAFDSDAGALLRTYLHALRDGDTPAEAYAATFGASGVDYDRALRNYMNDPLRGLLITLDDLAPSEIAVTRLSDQAGETALLSVRRGEEGREVAEDLLDDYPNDPQILAELARLQIENEDLEAALQSAERALEIDADHVDGNLYMGLALLAAAEAADDPDDPRWDRGRDFVTRANRADPLNALALFSYATSAAPGEPAPEMADEALESAFTLVPQNASIRGTYALWLAGDGDYRAAMMALSPLVEAPHGTAIDPGLRALLQELGERAERADADEPETSDNVSAADEE